MSAGLMLASVGGHVRLCDLGGRATVLRVAPLTVHAIISAGAAREPLER